MKKLNSVYLFRKIALLEGLSYLVLLGIAMPMKYMAGKPEWVQITGWLHGLLFVLYYPLLFLVEKRQKWSLPFFLWAGIASLLPFATFHVEKVVKKNERSTH